jgi:hypothetical protein
VVLLAFFREVGGKVAKVKRGGVVVKVAAGRREVTVALVT